jgi:N-acetylmuramic acid 6-phosphate (MurNAc-6-P) etherase
METLRLDRQAAVSLLDATGGEVKTAIVMGRFGSSAAEARSMLAAAGGLIAAVTGPDGDA